MTWKKKRIMNQSRWLTSHLFTMRQVRLSWTQLKRYTSISDGQTSLLACFLGAETKYILN